MSEMIERVARAICQVIVARNSSPGERCWIIPQWRLDQAREEARATLAAMREPTEAMLKAGEHIEDPDRHDDLWRAMIDAALKAPAGE